MTSPSVQESNIPRTRMDDAITELHCSSKHEEFKARLEGDGGEREIVRRLA